MPAPAPRLPALSSYRVGDAGLCNVNVTGKRSRSKVRSYADGARSDAEAAAAPPLDRSMSPQLAPPETTNADDTESAPNLQRENRERQQRQQAMAASASAVLAVADRSSGGTAGSSAPDRHWARVPMTKAVVRRRAVGRYGMNADVVDAALDACGPGAVFELRYKPGLRPSSHNEVPYLSVPSGAARAPEGKKRISKRKLVRS